MRQTSGRQAVPRITVVTPSYNQGRYIEQTLRSVLDQNYPNLEYIVMDGGSSDQTTGILRQYADRLTYWQSTPDKGQADALRQGFARGTGEIFCWLNSDDVLLPGSLEAVAGYFQAKPSVDVVSGGAYLIDAEGAPIRRWRVPYTMGVAASYSRLRFYGQEGVFQPATFWRRSVYEAAGGVDPEYRFIMDFDLFVRFAKRKRFGQLPRLLACFRLHEECKSMTIESVRLAELERYARSQLALDPASLFSRAARRGYWLLDRFRKLGLYLRLLSGQTRFEAVRP